MYPNERKNILGYSITFENIPEYSRKEETFL